MPTITDTGRRSVDLPKLESAKVRFKGISKYRKERRTVTHKIYRWSSKCSADGYRIVKVKINGRTYNLRTNISRSEVDVRGKTLTFYDRGAVKYGWKSSSHRCSLSVPSNAPSYDYAYVRDGYYGSPPFKGYITLYKRHTSKKTVRKETKTKNPRLLIDGTEIARHSGTLNNNAWSSWKKC